MLMEPNVYKLISTEKGVFVVSGVAVWLITGCYGCLCHYLKPVTHKLQIAWPHASVEKKRGCTRTHTDQNQQERPLCFLF